MFEGRVECVCMLWVYAGYIGGVLMVCDWCVDDMRRRCCGCVDFVFIVCALCM